MIESLAKVWSIQLVEDQDAVLAFGGGLTAKELLSPFKVTVWNICKGAGNENFTRDFRHLLAESDLFLLQEALLSSRAINTLHQENFLAIHGTSYRRLDGLRDGVLTLAKAQLIDPPKRILCTSPEPLLKTPKTSLLTNFLCANRNLSVINIHAKLLRTSRGLLAEMEHVFSYAPKSGPLLLAGDFNTFTPKLQSNLFAFLQERGLEVAIMESDKRSALASLDHVFVRDLIVQEAFVRSDILSSDHFPLTVKLSIKTRD
jgi:endonuclease/exonuclease/phosphatase (EEP) superfamily protein YafD